VAQPAVEQALGPDPAMALQAAAQHCLRSPLCNRAAWIAWFWAAWVALT